ncbi:hypothetical protein J6590_042702, partial [Homalodisca vitripennis]
MLEAGLLSDFSDSLILSTIHLHYTKLVIYKVWCLARRGGDWTVTRRVPIVCILIETTRGVSHGAVVVTVQQSRGAAIVCILIETTRGVSHGAVVVTVQQSLGAVMTRRVQIVCILIETTRVVSARWRDSDDMRGDSRGAVLTTRTHTLSRSLTIFCPRFGLTRFVPEPVS